MVGPYSTWESLGLFVVQVMVAPDTMMDEAATAEMSVGAGGGGALFTVTGTGTAAAISPAVLRATAPRV
ncbi:MAG: hypothetical protein AUH31_07570 [Armatimonadetes bacterium 13_1_40CM_64_14]|nr:MAG: hypothetical protein AUH31_07570 [Armatimonadetes bacterium 13_1_40CM_64_14]